MITVGMIACKKIKENKTVPRRNDSICLSVKLGDVEYETYKLHWDDAPRQITIPVDYASSVSFGLGELYSGHRYATYDISFE